MANMQLGNSAESITNSNFERKQFGIANVALVMELLSKHYSNPIQTLTQEYISNARDANREAKATRKIEITAPTKFNAIMQIRDFGPGLSPERIKEVFLFYGASTKRKDDNQVGGFGIGSKSAFAYTDSFTITSFIDGIKYTYIVHKSNNSGQMDKVTEEKTNEPNGVMVEIAVNPKDTQAFRNAIIRTIFFWKDNEKPIVKGIDYSETPDIKPSSTINNLHVYENLPNQFPTDYNSRSIIVIDGIPYPNRGHTPKLQQKIVNYFVLFLETGKVNIAPNREELINDDNTKNYLTSLDDKLHKELEIYIANQVKNLANVKSCLKIAVNLKKQFNGDIIYKNYVFSYNYLYVKDSTGKALTLGNYWEYHRRYRSSVRKKITHQINYSEIDNLYYDDMSNESNTKKVWRVKKTMEKNNNRIFTLLNSDLDAQIIADLGAKPLSSIDASDYKIERQAKASIKKLELCLHYFNGFRLDKTQVNLANVTDTIVYSLLNSKVYDQRHNNQVISFIGSKSGMKFAFIANGCEAKVKNSKNFISYEDYLKNYKPSDNEIKYYLKHKNTDLWIFDKIKTCLSEIKDPALKYFIELFTFNPGNTVSAKIIPEEMLDKKHQLVLEYEKFASEAKDFNQRYPLLVDFKTESLKKAEYKADVINYLNTKYKAFKKVVNP